MKQHQMVKQHQIVKRHWMVKRYQMIKQHQMHSLVSGRQLLFQMLKSARKSIICLYWNRRNILYNGNGQPSIKEKPTLIWKWLWGNCQGSINKSARNLRHTKNWKRYAGDLRQEMIYLVIIQKNMNRHTGFYARMIQRENSNALNKKNQTKCLMGAMKLVVLVLVPICLDITSSTSSVTHTS